jgi:DNA-directed RNA polymerase specialized sigma24 family protein
MESKFGQAVFDRLFQLLERDAQSVEEGFRQCRYKLVKFFAWRRCDDPDNLADETISRLLKNVQSGQEISSDNPYSYVYAIATNVFREYIRAKKKDLVLVAIDEIHGIGITAVKDDCQSQCVEKLPDEKRELLARYYLDDEDREVIARESGLSLNALRLQVHRIKHGLKRCVEECRKHSGDMRN